VEKGQVLVGQSFAGPFAGQYDSVPNRYVPLAPMSYSDNMGANAYAMKPKRQAAMAREVLEPLEYRTNGEEKGRVSELTYRDSLHVAFLEGKAYQDNPSLVVALHNIQNGLIAKDIAAAQRGGANLSFKYVDRQGRIKAYLVAYEGRAQEGGEPIIYISDFAAQDRKSLEAGKILLSFIESYKAEYVDKGRPLPIVLEARETTSYALLMNQLKNFEKRLGCKLDVKELGTHQSGSDTMHRVVITPIIAAKDTDSLATRMPDGGRQHTTRLSEAELAANGEQVRARAEAYLKMRRAEEPLFESLAVAEAPGDAKYEAAYDYKTHTIKIWPNVDPARVEELVEHELRHAEQMKFVAAAALAGKKLPAHFINADGTTNIASEILEIVRANPTYNTEAIQDWGEKYARVFAAAANLRVEGDISQYEKTLVEHDSRVS